MSHITYEEIVNALTEKGWQIITDQYTNLNTEMHFRCDEGHDVYTTWGKLRKKIECPSCKKLQTVFNNKEILAKPKGAHRVLALDQATHTTGYAIFDDQNLITAGTFETNAADEVQRIADIKNWFNAMMDNWRPDQIGLEGIQFQDESSGRKMGVTVFEALAHLQGVLQNTAYEKKIGCMVCPTNTWRHACGVKGKTRADKKKSMQLLVKDWYNITVSDDIADAVGIGYYLSHECVHISKIENWET